MGSTPRRKSQNGLLKTIANFAGSNGSTPQKLSPEEEKEPFVPSTTGDVFAGANRRALAFAFSLADIPANQSCVTEIWRNCRTLASYLLNVSSLSLSDDGADAWCRCVRPRSDPWLRLPGVTQCQGRRLGQCRCARCGRQARLVHLEEEVVHSQRAGRVRVCILPLRRRCATTAGQ